jgi:hypothetical protein
MTNINALNHRIGKLEYRNTRYIRTLADYVIWNAQGCPKPVEFDPKLAKILKQFYEESIAAEKDRNRERENSEP